MIILGYSLALLIGLSLGLLGGGGSILTVPVLHYVLGYGVKEAIPMSLVVVGLTSAVGAVLHARDARVNWRAALAFGPPAIVGALLGAELGLRAAAGIQLAVFAIVLVAAAVSMLRPRGDGARPVYGASSQPARRLPFVTLVGALVGVLTGFVGVGGGFLYVPALVQLGGLNVKEAVGTSLVLILSSCTAAVVRYHGPLAFDWGAIALFSAIAFVGVAAGNRLVKHAAQPALRKGFAVLLFVMGGALLLRVLSAGSAP
jgi:uncharacterized membrane protein YfcA